MKKINLFWILTAVLLITACTTPDESGIPNFEWMNHVGAQSRPAETGMVYNVNDFGAVGDAVVMNTEAIQKAIDECAANGGGIVTFSPGIYLTGSVFVKSGIIFEIPKGTQIIGSQDIADYKIIPTRVAGVEMEWPAALINVIDQDNVVITGDGVIHGRGKPFWDAYWELRREYQQKGLRWIVDYDAQRPRGVLVSNCTNVTLEDFVLYQAGFWSVHVVYSEHVTMDGLIISNNIEGRGPSTDGIDIDSSSMILVENCYINCNDDNICLKAGRDADGLRVNRPCEYVVIRNCITGSGHGVFTCGSETSGGIRNIVAYNIKAVGTTYGIRFKSAYNRGGVVEDIYLHNIEMIDVREPFILQMNWNPSYSYSTLPEEYDYDEIPSHWKTFLEPVDPDKAMPTFRNIYLSNVTSTGARNAIVVEASEDSPVEGFSFKNVSFEAQHGGRISHAKNWHIENVSITVEENELQISDSQNVNF